MVDRTTKALLLAIAVGIWLNAAIQFLAASSANEISNRMSFVEQWLIRGAHVTMVSVPF